MKRIMYMIIGALLLISLSVNAYFIIELNKKPIDHLIRLNDIYLEKDIHEVVEHRQYIVTRCIYHEDNWSITWVKEKVNITFVFRCFSPCGNGICSWDLYAVLGNDTKVWIASCYKFDCRIWNETLLKWYLEEIRP